MADERYVVMTVECEHCRTKQKVHISAHAGGSQKREQTIICIRCNNHFRVTVPDQIIDGPFPT
jgi:hypothetical protein